ncbi:hypothetical protein OAL23_01305, partial [bacterium]|nr:hypothetical protein [bacterium]
MNNDGRIYNNATLHRSRSRGSGRLRSEFCHRILQTFKTGNESLGIPLFGNLGQLFLDHFVISGLRHPLILTGIQSLSPVIEKALLPCQG